MTLGQAIVLRRAGAHARGRRARFDAFADHGRGRGAPRRRRLRRLVRARQALGRVAAGAGRLGRRRASSPASRSTSAIAPRCGSPRPSRSALVCRGSALTRGSRATPRTLNSMSHGRPVPHPQLLDHRPHRPREVDAGRSHPRDDPHGRPAVDARPAARLDGPRARARDHDQGPGRARLLHEPGRRDLPAPPHRHARARRLHLRGLALAWPRARARCWSSTPRRASRRRRSPTPTWRSTSGLELIPCLNKIDLPGAEPERVAEEVAELLGEPRRRRSAGSPARPARASRRSSRSSSPRSRRPTATRTRRRAR